MLARAQAAFGQVTQANTVFTLQAANWGSGYAARYYAYLWTDMIEENVYDWCRAHGGMMRANCQRLRDLVLSRGRTPDYEVMFRNMVGHDPQVAPLLRSRS